MFDVFSGSEIGPSMYEKGSSSSIVGRSSAGKRSVNMDMHLDQVRDGLSVTEWV